MVEDEVQLHWEKQLMKMIFTNILIQMISYMQKQNDVWY